jgi:hypothetical protein
MSADAREQITKILIAFGKGDESLGRQNWSEAVLQYSEATNVLSALPESEPFDRSTFVASCLAGAAVANIGLEDHALALQCADTALLFFDKVSNMYPTERGRWLLSVLAKGIALSVLGRTAEAEQCRIRSKQMLMESGTGLRFQAEIDELIKTLEGLLHRDSIESKRWWQLWK